MSNAMYSGVAGMKAHQQEMDVIGNNIANVNTYGYKSQRALFSDVYYQTLSAATGGTANKGGTNPSTVGVGSMLESVETNQTRSGLQNTGYGLDVAITGEGYFQVMDGSGNIYYTKAGMLGYDANTGYLTDVNGNFILGYQGANKDGDGKQKIKLDNVGAVQPKAAAATQLIHNNNFTMNASNESEDGNLSVNIAASDSLPIGQPVEATISNGSITVTLNARSRFTSIDDLNTKINTAITVANGGRQIDAGDLQLSVDNAEAFPAGGLTGAQIAGTDYGYDYGTIAVPKSGIFGGFKLEGVGAEFRTANDTDKATFTLKRVPAAGDAEEYFEMTCTVGTKIYTGQVTKSQMETAGKMVLSNGGSTTDTITMDYPTYASVMNTASIGAATWATVGDPSADLTKQLQNGEVLGGIKISGYGDGVHVTGVTAGPATAATPTTAATVPLSVTTNDGTTYTGTIDFGTSFSAGAVTLTGAAGKSITVSLPSKASFLSAANGPVTGGYDTGITFADTSAENLDVTGTTQSKDLGLSTSPFVLSGGTAGGAVSLNEISDIAIGSDGTITVHNADKGTVKVGQICLATFANPSGLQAAGNNYYTASLNSGDPHITTPGSDSSGELKSSSLEMSNVDLASEFANMITTQRGFQANARIITVSDSMMEELINLKR